MIIFSVIELLDEQKCYDFLKAILHPMGLHCPKCQCTLQDSKIHRRDREPILCYECAHGHFYNLFTKTIWQGTHHRCPMIVRILQGVAQGVLTHQVTINTDEWGAYNHLAQADRLHVTVCHTPGHVFGQGMMMGTVSVRCM